MIYNFVTVCVGDAYGAEYPNAIYNMVEKNFHAPFKFYCVTDREDLRPEIEVIKPTHKLEGWWNKLYLFSPLMPPGRLVYIDLDVVIMNDFTDLVTGYSGKFCGDEDHIHYGKLMFGGKHSPVGEPIDCSLGTAFVMMESGVHTEIWTHYLTHRKMIEQIFRRHGDQVYISWRVKTFDLIEKLFPETHGFCSYKFDIVNKNLDPFKFKMINFHGKPKPKELLETLWWVKEAWTK